MIKQNLKFTLKDGKVIKSENYDNGIMIIDDSESHLYQDSVILPAFTDSHCHIWGLGMKATGLDFSDCNTAVECCEKALKSPFYRGNWLVGRGWNQEKWGGKLPDKSLLDMYFPNTPVCFTRIDGHSIWVNSKAIEVSGIDSHSSQIDGGEFLLDENSFPIGIFIDNATQLIEKNIPPFSKNQLKHFILKGIDLGIKAGITSFHDMDISKELHEIYIELDKNNELKANVYSFLAAQNREYLMFEDNQYEGKNYKVQGIKLYADGALGSRGAALFEPYNDYSSNGLLLANKTIMTDICKEAATQGFDIAIHAIGDRAVRMIIDIFGELRNDKFIDNKLRIEHSQLVRPEDIILYTKYNIIASVQPIHCVSDAKMADVRLGKERASLIAYPWQSFLDNKVLLIAGSDFPIENESVIAGIDAFVNRIGVDMNIAWNVKEKININDAIMAFTFSPQAAVDNSINDSISAGLSTDFVILENFDEKQILITTIKAVFKHGKLIYEKN